MDTRRIPRPALAGILVLSFAVTACSSAAAPSPQPSAISTAPADDGGGGGSGGAVPGDPGTGAQPGDPGAGGVVPDPQATLVFPKPGVIDPRPVPVSKLAASLADGHLVIRVEWTSGVEPCYTLAGVGVTREGGTFTLQVLEGSTGRDVACVEMAQYKATTVDLGQQPAGTYTIAADPPAVAPLTVSIP